MKKLLLSLFIGAACFAGNAQKISVGVRAGLNFSNVKDKLGNQSQTGDLKLGAHAGIALIAELTSKLRLNPEADVSIEGWSQTQDGTHIKYNLYYVNVPVLLQYAAGGGFFAETGPQMGLMIAADATANKQSVNIKDQFYSTNFSWVIGAGFHMPGGIGFGARYNLGLSNIAKAATGGEKMTASTIQISILRNFR